ncbi:MAG: glutamate 5-kinase [Nitrospinaceae bacterium]|nr:glutamate 5-kinase [Nitrospina sp.]MBT5376770.1 glutamate 5-kinase [Nitrospinaceae bacterium]MBT6345777.1 glutamate 5-kinase [Nitrospina sp.]
MAVREDILQGVKRVVVKIGSSVISNRDKGRSPLECGLSRDWVRHYARKIKTIRDRGIDVVLVSSGAIMAGRERLEFARADLTVPEKQACAAIGQSFLMHTYEKAFEKKELKVAQILLSHDDLGNRKRYLNAKHTIETLLEKGVIPIINENDSVTVEEIKIGDNDSLSATVACLVDAQLLIILSDVEGLYDRDPSVKVKAGVEKAQLLSHISKVNEDIEKIAGKSNNHLTVGGMVTKVRAAKKTMSFGIPTLVVNGLDEKVIENIFAGKEVGTLFWSGKGKIRDRKHWIAHTLKSAGTLTLDTGARKALLERGKSLLPAGLLKVTGSFEFGNAVTLLDELGKEIGRGLVNYNSRDLENIKGLKTSAVRSLMGKSFYEEVVHRDDLVIF